MKQLLFIGLFFSTLCSNSQPVTCSCDSVFSQKITRTLTVTIPSFKYNQNVTLNSINQHIATDTIASIRKMIDEVDSLIKNHFDTEVKEQLRGIRDSFEGRKYIKANAHANFLCRLDSLYKILDREKSRFQTIQIVPSISPIFQAYLNSLAIYHDQSRSLVNWNVQRTGKVRCVAIHEGSINIYSQSYNFVELCKNNLLKEFSILELAYVADSLRKQTTMLREQIDILQGNFNTKNKILQDSLNSMNVKLNTMQSDTLLKIIRNARQEKNLRRIIIKL